MNISNLQILLQEAIDNSTASVDHLLLARAIESLRMGQIRTVATFGDLPTAFENEGLLIFVESDERVYFSNGSFWINLILSVTTQAWSWGSGTIGRLGDGTTINRSLPVSVVGGFTDWCQVSAGNHSLAVRIDGTAWAWGYNGSGNFGSLGDGTTINRSSPVSVVGGFTDWCQLSAGFAHSVGLRTNGTAWAWGCGGQLTSGQGRLGDNSTISRSSPVSVVGGFTDWCQVSAGCEHSLGLRTNGTVWAWGSGGQGRLGTNETISRSSPVSVVGGFTDWCQVSAGCEHSLGLRTNGTVWAWGSGTRGRLGTNETINRSSPVSVVGGFTDWCQVSAGYEHSLGLRTNGTAWAWGAGSNGRLGTNETLDRSSPVSVVGGFTDWCQVSAGFHSLGLRTNGTVWAWGIGGSGRLGDGTTTNKSSPVSVIGGFTNWCQVSAGRCHSLAIRFNTN
jgi:alpha-tubulin suppressor-like RCC1 family protein